MERTTHHRAFAISIPWTLFLLFLGSVVHATESSLACPDWPTCYGTMMPDMVGGVFWEHLHRLVAGGLILIFGAGTWLAWKAEAARPWVRWTALGGVFLLLVQSVLGGLTVIFRLPDAVSTSHLTAAFLFLALTTVLAVATGPRWGRPAGLAKGAAPVVRKVAIQVSVLVMAQSVLGALVRHTDAGMACPDVPLCLGRWIPDLGHPLVAIHFLHRVVGVVLALAVVALVVLVFRRSGRGRVRNLAVAALVIVVDQVALGFLSVATTLDVIPVSLHTLLAASLLTVTVALAAYGWSPGVVESKGEAAPVTSTAGADGR